MAYVCERCGKGRLVGHNVSHAKNRTQKISLPNLHKVSFGRGQESIRLCSNCLRAAAR